MPNEQPDHCEKCGAVGDGCLEQYHGTRYDGDWLCNECYCTARMEE
jgi:hypothetical protein